MKYISTSEASKLWNISSRRIAMLAAEGRIKGALRTGKSWLIPIDAPKPSDGRRKENQSLDDLDSRFCFPLLFITISDDHCIGEHFSTDEQRLIEAQLCHERGEFEQSRSISEAILETCKNRYIRIGALYCLCFTCVIQRDFDSARKYIALFRSAVSVPDVHQKELELLNMELNATFGTTDYFETDFLNMDFSDLSPELMPFVACLAAFTDVLRASQSNFVPCIASHIVNCSLLEHQGYYNAATYLNYYISLMLIITGKIDSGKERLTKTLIIAAERDILFTISGWLLYIPDIIQDILSRLPDELREKTENFYHSFSMSVNDFLAFSGKPNFYSLVSDTELRILGYFMRNYSQQKIAELEGIKVSSVRKLVSDLSAKLGCDPKKLAKELFTNNLDCRLPGE